MKKRFLRYVSALVMVVMALSMCINKNVKVSTAHAATMNFADVSMGKWYYTDVKYVYDNSLMNGVSTFRFAPDSPCTRGMLVTILYRLEGSPAVSGNSFTDVP